MKMKPRDVAGAGTGAQDETLTATQESETVSYKYVKNTSSHKFHLSGCDSVKDMKEKNKEYSNQSREEIIAEGYKPCKRCTP
jgi:methylphosphotriester-DNA--protein-cysteine methyltransferase